MAHRPRLIRARDGKSEGVRQRDALPPLRAARYAGRALSRSPRSIWISLLAAGALGCGGEPSTEAAPATRSPTPGCRAPAAVSSAPTTIAETVTLINALSKPLSLPCFLESLSRPLQLHATSSLFSAQPSQGKRSPRIFLFSDPLILSIVPAGDGAHLLEFGEQRPDLRSLKAEIPFPVTAPLEPSAPFDKLMFNEQFTTCGGCHAAEEQEAVIGGVRTFVSLALRPRAIDRVTALSLSAELQSCDEQVEPERCAMLDALMSWGEVAERDFPAEMATFGGN